MQKDTPLTENSISSDGVLGDNLELLILHRAYLNLTENDEEKREEKENDNKN